MLFNVDQFFFFVAGNILLKKVIACIFFSYKDIFIKFHSVLTPVGVLAWASKSS